MATVNQWWVVKAQAIRNQLHAFNIVQSPSKPSGVQAGPFASKADAQSWINTQQKTGGNTGKGQTTLQMAGGAVTGWLSSLGGMIGSGIEQGIVSTLGDIWNVIVGPLEVIAGFIVVAVVLTIYFKDDIVEGISLLAKIFGSAAVVAA